MCNNADQRLCRRLKIRSSINLKMFTCIYPHQRTVNYYSFIMYSPQLIVHSYRELKIEIQFAQYARSLFAVQLSLSICCAHTHTKKTQCALRSKNVSINIQSIGYTSQVRYSVDRPMCAVHRYRERGGNIPTRKKNAHTPTTAANTDRVYVSDNLKTFRCFFGCLGSGCPGATIVDGDLEV